MAAKFKEYYERMVEMNKNAFEQFKQIHDEYGLNPENLQEKFNTEGEKILTIIRDWENKLCMQSEKAGFANYTTNLAEKFQEEVRKHFPEIVNVGLKVEKKDNGLTTSLFQIKKINLK